MTGLVYDIYKSPLHIIVRIEQKQLNHLMYVDSVYLTCELQYKIRESAKCSKCYWPENRRSNRKNNKA